MQRNLSNGARLVALSQTHVKRQQRSSAQSTSDHCATAPYPFIDIRLASGGSDSARAVDRGVKPRPEIITGILLETLLSSKAQLRYTDKLSLLTNQPTGS